MKQIISHWRLAFRTVKKAIQVTISVPFNWMRAYIYSMTVYGKLERQRELFSLIPNDETIECKF